MKIEILSNEYNRNTGIINIEFRNEAEAAKMDAITKLWVDANIGITGGDGDDFNMCYCYDKFFVDGIAEIREIWKNIKTTANKGRPKAVKSI